MVWEAQINTQKLVVKIYLTIPKRQRTANFGLAILWLKCFYETFVQSSTAVIPLSPVCVPQTGRSGRESFRSVSTQTEEGDFVFTKMILYLTELMIE